MQQKENKNDDDCQDHVCAKLDEEQKQKFNSAMQDQTLNYAADTFRVLGDRTRVKILATLLDGEKDVCTISQLVDLTHSAVSHQLAMLKQTRLVRYEKRGKRVFYCLNDAHIVILISMAIDHVREGENDNEANEK